jgi:hypothetical protein
MVCSIVSIDKPAWISCHLKGRLAQTIHPKIFSATQRSRELGLLETLWMIRRYLLQSTYASVVSVRQNHQCYRTRHQSGHQAGDRKRLRLVEIHWEPIWMHLHPKLLERRLTVEVLHH